MTVATVATLGRNVKEDRIGLVLGQRDHHTGVVRRDHLRLGINNLGTRLEL